MCQHVRGRDAGSSERGDGEAGVSVRVPRVRTSALSRLVVDGNSTDHRCLCSRWLDALDALDTLDGYHEPCVQRARERRRERRGVVSRQVEALSQDPRQVGQPRRSAGRGVGQHRVAGECGLVPGTSVRDRRRETFGPEEARTSASLQSRPSGRRARTLGDGSQQSRLQDRFHTSAWPQGRLEAAHCWKDAFFSRPFAASLQVFVLFFFFFKSTPIRRRKWNTRGPKEDARWSRVLEPIVSTATRVSTRLSCFLRIFLFLSRSVSRDTNCFGFVVTETVRSPKISVQLYLGMTR